MSDEHFDGDYLISFHDQVMGKTVITVKGILAVANLIRGGVRVDRCMDLKNGLVVSMTIRAGRYKSAMEAKDWQEGGWVTSSYPFSDDYCELGDYLNKHCPIDKDYGRIEADREIRKKQEKEKWLQENNITLPYYEVGGKIYQTLEDAKMDQPSKPAPDRASIERRGAIVVGYLVLVIIAVVIWGGTQ